ncbi:hypothetical protein K469DRAFT_636271 [Zopfia rhizophila CBS 207.26]|uniref:F-box domain-containing protein n=1 Tax=Zopfia rhizophila CBS 207.26 TaxID=1314779 RepID=A0A6A6DYY9_9PEZI|nr:hypothetical protein K469DRAFT_636271 [Zopfia rhizophila CBS 207.26]
MASFADLSAELVEQIISYIHYQDTLHALLHICRSLYTLVVPYLYRNVDLSIRRNKKVPRIDSFLYLVMGNPKYLKHVESLRVGLARVGGLKEGPRYLPKLSGPQHCKLIELLSKEPWIMEDDLLHEAILSGCCGAFATVLILSLPSLRCLEVSDYSNGTLGELFRFLQRRSPSFVREMALPSPSALSLISSLQEVYHNVDKCTGVRYADRQSHVQLRSFFFLPEVRKLEFFIPDGEPDSITRSHPRLHGPSFSHRDHIDSSSITTIVIRYTSCALLHLSGILRATPQLQSLTCDNWYDLRTTRAYEDINSPWLNMWKWNKHLKLVKNTPRTLVLGVEFYDSRKSFFRQPSFEHKYYVGDLDLTEFEKLETLEVPMPCLSGDPRFSIFTMFEPRLPPNLRHISLRSDMSRAQFAFQFNARKIVREDSLESTLEDARHDAGARMDLSYIFRSALLLLECPTELESLSTWQPAESTWAWVDRQLEDLTMAGRNKSIAIKVIYPMLLRLKKPEHWNLVKEVTLFDPSYPGRKAIEKLIRGERGGGLPLGLAMQYHLNELLAGHVLGADV